MNETLLVALLSFLGVLAVQMPAILLAVKALREMTALKIHVNSNTDKLVASVKELATKTGHDEGHAAGVQEGVVKADALAAATAVATDPRELVVTKAVVTAQEVVVTQDERPAKSRTRDGDDPE